MLCIVYIAPGLFSFCMAIHNRVDSSGFRNPLEFYFVEVNSNIPADSGFHWNMADSSGIHWNMADSSGIQWNHREVNAALRVLKRKGDCQPEQGSVIVQLLFCN
jgi:hypothetical protein